MTLSCTKGPLAYKPPGHVVEQHLGMAVLQAIERMAPRTIPKLWMDQLSTCFYSTRFLGCLCIYMYLMSWGKDRPTHLIEFDEWRSEPQFRSRNHQLSGWWFDLCRITGERLFEPHAAQPPQVITTHTYIYILSSDSCCKGWAKPARNCFSLPLWVTKKFGRARSNVIDVIWGGQQKTIKRPRWWLLSPIFFLLRQFLTAVAFVIMMVSCSTILKFLIREAGECPGFCYPPDWWFH